jgi:hypothetical protein
MRPTRDPKYEEAWLSLSNTYESKTKAKPSMRYSSTYCYYCNKGWGKGRKRTRQHLLPTRRGGLYITGNLRWCCYLCNQLLSMVDDCPVILNVYKTLIAETPLRHLPLYKGFLVYIAMRDDRCNKFIVNLINILIGRLKHNKNKYIIRKILIYMKKSFPGVIRNQLPKEEIPFIFSKTTKIKHHNLIC